MLSIHFISKSFGESTVLENISLEICPEESIVLLGQSGCGKTTLARIITGLTPPDSGYIIFNGNKLKPLCRHREFADMAKIQYIFQDPYSALEQTFTLQQTLAEPYHICKRHGYAPMNIQDALEIVDPGLPMEMNRRINTFSGGQQQKICIARALITKPLLLIADESTAMLDNNSSIEIYNILNRIKKETGLSILAIVHDLDFSYNKWDKIAVMDKGRLHDIMAFNLFLYDAQSEYAAKLIESYRYFYSERM